MNTETLEFPKIAEAATEVVDAAPAKPAESESSLVLIRRSALVELSAVDRGIAALKDAHGAIDYDIKTPKGLQAAKDHRMAVRDARYKVPHIVKARKAELKTVQEALESEAERITNELLAIEKPHDDAIKAREQQLAEEKAERDRKDAERKAEHEGFIVAIRSWLTRCQEPGMTAARIANGIAGLEAIEVGKEREEYEDRARAAHAETLAAMRTLHAQTWAREQEAERLERQRLENERAAAELAEARRQLEAQAAAVRKQQEELADQRAAEDARVAALAKRREEDAAAESARLAAEQEARERQQAEATAQAHAAAVQAIHEAEAAGVIEPEQAEHLNELTAGVAAEVAIATASASAKRVITVDLDNTPPAPLPPQPEPATVSLGSLKAEVLGPKGIFSEEFIRETLKVEAQREGKSTLYTKTQRTQILRAFIAHIEGII